MKLRVFQSNKGDCLLIESSDGRLVLVDGGLVGSYRDHVAPALGELRDEGRDLDVVCVSHIDQDHIAGILRMADDLVDWKVFDFQRANGNTHFRKPRSVRPPTIGKVWNNAFHDQVGENAGRIESMLAARARALSLIDGAKAQKLSEHYAELVYSKAEAIELSRRLGDRQLAVPVNPEFDHGFMFVTDPPAPLRVGTLAFTVIGPFLEDLEKLRDEWNDWLRTQDAQDRLADIRREHGRDEDNLGNALIDVLGPLLFHAAEMGDRDDVTLPNLASLMFHLEGDGRTVLLTGDGHWEDLLAGLEATEKMAPGGGLHVDVLKVQHHGSEHNWHRDFGRRVTADHYVFCANGSDENPDLEVIDAVLESRLGGPSRRSPNPEAEQAFKLWFNSSSGLLEGGRRHHMEKIEAKLAAAQESHPDRVRSFFLKGSSFQIPL